jgi:hypothetical protein
LGLNEFAWPFTIPQISTGIPTFLLLNDDFSLISRNGLHLLLSEPQNYPWKRKAIYELNEFTAQRLSELPALILFTGRERIPFD